MLLSLPMQVKVKRERKKSQVSLSSALQRLDQFSEIWEEKDCGNYLTCLTPKIASSQKASCTAAAQTETTPGINPELCIWLAFYLRLCRLSKADPMQKPRRDSCLWVLTLTLLPPRTTQQGGGKSSCFPTAPNKIHLTISPCYLLKNCYSCLAPGTVITECGRGWTLLKLRTFRKDLVACFFFFFLPYNKNQQFCRSDLHFLNPVIFHIKEVYVPKHMWA